MKMTVLSKQINLPFKHLARKLNTEFLGYQLGSAMSCSFHQFQGSLLDDFSCDKTEIQFFLILRDRMRKCR